MGLGTVIPDELADLHISEPADKPRAEKDTDKKSGQARIDRPESNVPEYIQYRDDIA